MIDLTSILKSAETIAVVGSSNDPYRTSNSITRYLMEAGYRVIPVNPNHEEVLGERCYPDLESIPDENRIDIVNIFRRREFTADMVAMTIEYARNTGTKPLIWTQLNVSSTEAEKMAEEAGLPYVRNRCIMVEHRHRL